MLRSPKPLPADSAPPPEPPARPPVASPPLRTLAPRTSDRCLFVGSTGSGKTTLSLAYIAKVRSVPVVIIDTKGDDAIARFATRFGYYETDRLCTPSEKYPRIVVRGEPDGEYWDPLFWKMLAVGGLIYIDELLHLATAWNSKRGKGIRSAYATGRGRRLGVWASTQRPSMIPISAMSEADHIYGFRVSFPEDEDRMSRLIRFGRSGFDSNALPPFGFAYHTHGLATPIVGRAITPIV